MQPSSMALIFNLSTGQRQMSRHPNEPYENEDMVSVNVESIKAKPGFLPGRFASYPIYPYYPDLVFYQKEYASFRDAVLPGTTRGGNGITLSSEMRHLPW